MLLSKLGLKLGLTTFYPKILRTFSLESSHFIITFKMSGVTFTCENLFMGEVDRYQCVSVSSEKEPRTEAEFPKVLQCSITNWKENKVRGVWVKVYLEHSFWIPTLVGNGFTYHHAKQNYVTMVKWLPEDEPNNLPCFAHNTIGVGAFVVNEAEELLVVRERCHKTLHWKLPGGYVELGEDLSVAAIREVKEETGIDTDFESLLAFRHLHKAIFECSNLYFIVQLKPKSHKITMCKKELADCRWMKLKDYLEHPDVIEMNKFFARCYLERKLKGTQIRVVPNKLELKNFSRDQVLYFVDSTGAPALSLDDTTDAPDSSRDTNSKI